MHTVNIHAVTQVHILEGKSGLDKEQTRLVLHTFSQTERLVLTQCFVITLSILLRKEQPEIYKIIFQREKSMLNNG